MRVLVTGSEGYIGAVLRDVLSARDHDVIGLDTGYFDECILGEPPSTIPIIRRDVREVEIDDFEGIDAVIHLAALSNDPLGDLEPGLTEDINTKGSIRVALKAKAAGVTRFLFASSCSLYGHGEKLGLTEQAAANPQTAYARSKVDFETALRELAGDDFSPTYLRNATAFGMSRRPRLDVVVNNLTACAWTTGKIEMTSDGTPWRPLVHVQDISRAFACALEAPRDAIHDQAFNVGSAANNVQIKDIAYMVQKRLPDCEVTFGSSDGDSRTYNVDFTKIETELPGFHSAQYSIPDAIDELVESFDAASFRDSDFHGRLYVRLRQIQHLQDSGRLDGNLFWLPRAGQIGL